MVQRMIHSRVARFLALLVVALVALPSQAQLILEQATASQAVMIGPFVDSTNGVDAETGLTIDAADVRISVNGGNIVGKNSGGCTHDELGMYQCTFDATDTATVGRMQVVVAESGALPVYHEFIIVEEAVHANFYDASAVGPLTAAAVNTEADTALSDYDPPTNAEVVARTLVAASYFDPAADTVVNVTNVAQSSVDELQASALADLFNTDSGTTYGSAVSGSVVAEIADNAGGSALTEAGIADAVWDELQSGHITAGSFGEVATEVAGILADTNELQTDDYPTTLATLATSAALATVDSNVDAVLVDTSTTLDDYLDTEIAAILADTAEIGSAGAGLTAVPWNSAWDPEVQSETDDALVAAHLDHLFEQDYDPASPPGTATALFNELIESDGGVSRFTTNALEQGPSGGGSLTDDDLGYWTTTISTVNSQTEFVLAGGSADNGAYDGWGVIVQDQSTSAQRSLRYASCSITYVGSTNTLTISAAADFTAATGDTIILAPALACSDGTEFSSVPWNSAWDAEVQSEVADALTVYDPPTDTEMDSAFGALNDLSAAAVNAEVDTALSDYDGPTDAEMDAGFSALNDPTAAAIVAAILGESCAAPGAGTIEEQLCTDLDAVLVDTGTTLQGEVDGIQADTEDIQSRIPASLNNGVMPSDVQRINDVEITGDGSATPFDVP